MHSVLLTQIDDSDADYAFFHQSSQAYDTSIVPSGPKEKHNKSTQGFWRMPAPSRTGKLGSESF